MPAKERKARSEDMLPTCEDIRESELATHLELVHKVALILSLIVCSLLTNGSPHKAGV